MSAPRTVLQPNTGSTASSDPAFAVNAMRSLGTLVAVLLLAASPLRAQGLPTLDELIPDEAVADPEGWAQQGGNPDGLTPDDIAGPDARSPMEPMPLLTLDAPDNLELPPVEPLAPAEPVEFVTFDDVIQPLPEVSVERLSDELVLAFPSERSLFPERNEFLGRFKSLSAVEDLETDGSPARLAAQARADEELLRRLLDTYGYFDAQVIRSVEVLAEGADAGAAPVARFDVIPGRRFTIGTVDLGELASAGADYAALRAAYEVAPGDPVSLDAITTERYDLDIALGESGYPFAAIEDPALLVDHARLEGDVTMAVMPGGRYLFGAVRSGMEDFLPSGHLADIARFEPGDLYRRSDEMDLRRAILATGLVGSVTITPVEASPPQGEQPGIVDIGVGMTPAPLRTLAGSIGFGTEEGVRLAGSWEHRNLFPPEGMLRVRGIIGTQEQLAGVTFRKNNFNGRDRILTVDAFASNIENVAFEAQTASVIGTYERVSTLLFQKPLSYGGGLELVATDERDRKARSTIPPRQTFLIAALPAWAQLDTSDDLLDPTEGFRLRGAASPELSRTNGANSTYAKLQFDLSYYQSASDSVVLAARARAGTIVGADLADIAPSRRFYAGGGGSVRGYGYQAIGPRDGLGDANGGRSLLELSAEVRVRTGLMDGAISVVPFVDAGVVNEGSVPDFSDIRVGVGLGVRYQTGFGPIRLDVGVPLNRRPGDAPVAVYVALGQAF
jgi:translocation and assembly module TamA